MRDSRGGGRCCRASQLSSSISFVVVLVLACTTQGQSSERGDAAAPGVATSDPVAEGDSAASESQGGTQPLAAPASPSVSGSSQANYAAALSEGAAVGDSGVSWGPQWDLLGDSSVNTLDPSKPSASLGVQYVSAGTLLRLQIRKNLADSSVTAARGEAAFGKAVLDPGLSNLSIKLRFEGRLYAPFILCRKGACTKPDVDQIALRHGARFYAEFAAATATFNVQAKDQAAPSLSKTGVPVAASLGLTYRVEGVMPGGAKFGSSALMLSPYLGAAARAFGGDFTAEDRRALWADSSSLFLGGELGSFFQFGSLLFDARVTLLVSTADSDAHISGLTVLQFQLSTTFLLPWNVLGAKEDPAKP